jgi:hypothetical protein
MPSRTSTVRLSPRRLTVVIESALHELVQRCLTSVAERGMPEVVAESDGLGQDFVEAQRLRDRPRDLGHFQHVR